MLVTAQELFARAVREHRAGDLDEAEKLYRRLLEAQPRHAEALDLLGVVAGQRGQHAQATDLIRRAIALDPGPAHFHVNLGMALEAQGKLQEAAGAYRSAIQLRADLPEAHNNLGGVLQRLGRAEESITACRLALQLRPDYAEAHNNLGNALAATGRWAEAIAAYQQAIALRPALPEPYSNLGNVLKSSGHLTEAVEAYGHAIAMRPTYAEALNKLSDTLRLLGRLGESESVCRRAIAVRPDWAQAHSNLGNTLAHQARMDEAITAYRLAIQLQPNLAEAHNNLGRVYKDIGLIRQATEEFAQAARLRPDVPVFGSNLLYVMHFDSRCDGPTILAAHRTWAEVHADPLSSEIRVHGNDRNPARLLRVGYISPDFVDHPVGRFLLPLLENQDRARFETVCYSDVRVEDAVTQRLRSCANTWHNTLGLSDAALAQQVQQDRIDILVDLTLHAANNRLLTFARKPAPVQVSYLAYPGTTGLSAMDYRLTDAYLDPPGASDDAYSEKSVRLQSYWCYRPPSAAPDVGSLPCRDGGLVTFGCLNNFAKVSEDAISLWVSILEKVPDARLLLHAPNSSHRQRVLDALAQAALPPARIEFVDRQAITDYLSTYNRIDIALDPFPYAGGTTTCDALWMGCPAVTLAGQTAVGRAGVSLLSQVGLGELIAQKGEQYVSIAVRLASDLPRLAKLRSEMRQRMAGSPLMGERGFARDIERAYREMWQTWCAANASPARFARETPATDGARS